MVITVEQPIFLGIRTEELFFQQVVNMLNNLFIHFKNPCISKYLFRNFSSGKANYIKIRMTHLYKKEIILDEFPLNMDLPSPCNILQLVKGSADVHLGHIDNITLSNLHYGGKT